MKYAAASWSVLLPLVCFASWSCSNDDSTANNPGSTGSTTSGQGSSTGSAGAGGDVGSGGAGGSIGGIVASFACVKNSYGECLADSWLLFPCYTQFNYDCITNIPGTGCPAQDSTLPMEDQGLTTDEYFTMGGTPGKMYSVSLQINGVAEGKYYDNGMRAAGNMVPANINGSDGVDGWYTGGAPRDFESYNILKLIVRNPPTAADMPASGMEIQHYYLNSVPDDATRQFEDRNTFAFASRHDIVVPAGGVVQYHTGDRNCHAVDNCGPGAHTSTCAVTDGRLIPNEPNVALPQSYMGKAISTLNRRNGGNQPFHAQVLHITVTAVTEM